MPPVRPTGAVPRPAGPATPPHGTPQARGGHPEQREPGGGWGATRGVPPGPGERSAGPFGGARPISSPTYGTGSMPGPRAAGAAGDAFRAGTGGHRPPGPRITGPQIPGPRIPGPRQEYIDAFDGDHGGDLGNDDDVDVFTPRRAPRAQTTIGSGSGSLLAGSDVYRAPGDEAPAGSAAGPATATGPPGGPFDAPPRGVRDDDTDPADAPPDAEPDDRDGSRRAMGAKGRTFTGIAAAAVTTVLAVVVAGQVTHGRPGASSSRADRKHSDTERAPHAGNRPDRAGHAPGSAPLTYDQKMHKVYPINPHLKATGKFETIPGHDKAPGQGRVYRYRVDVEKGLDLDGELFAQAIQKTLNDDRSWSHGGARSFERVSSGSSDFVITLASPGTTGVWCAKSGLDTMEQNVSCDSAATDRVVINAYRWARGSKTYGDAIYAYRQMLINHEVGHRLGRNHAFCTRQGALAPVMQQQTKFLTYHGITCRPNPWPFPDK